VPEPSAATTIRLEIPAIRIPLVPIRIIEILIGGFA
jgi:hypothetical protein